MLWAAKTPGNHPATLENPWPVPDKVIGTLTARPSNCTSEYGRGETQAVFSQKPVRECLYWLSYNCPRAGNDPGVLQQVIGCAPVARPHHGIALGKKEWTTDAQTSRAEPRHTTPASLRLRGIVRTAWHCNKEGQTEQDRKSRTGPVSIWKSWYHEWKKPVLKMCTLWFHL